MKKYKYLSSLFLLLLTRSNLSAVNNIEITNIQRPLMTINSANAGNSAKPHKNKKGRYFIESDTTVKDIVAKIIGVPPPNGVNIAISLDAPKGGQSLGFVELNTTSSYVVRDIPPTRVGGERNLKITYLLTASDSSDPVSLQEIEIELELL